MNKQIYSPGVRVLMEKHPNHRVHETTVKGGFPVIYFYLMEVDEETNERFIEDEFVVTVEGQNCDGWLGLTNSEIEALGQEVFANAATRLKRIGYSSVKGAHR